MGNIFGSADPESLQTRDLTYHFNGHKMQGQFHCNGYMYDKLLFGDFDTVAYKVQLDDNYLAL